MLALVITGCATSKIATMSMEGRHDVFQEVAHEKPVPAGYTELTIVSSLKTRKPGDFLRTTTSRGTPDYMLLLNIDGQTSRVKGDLTEEKTVSHGSWNLETGEGIRYFFKIKLLLKPGRHSVFAALPEDGVYLDRIITLLEETDNVLHLTPVYGKRKVGKLPDLNAEASFYEGTRGFKAFLNGKAI